jgi:hypothetical protein
MREVKPVTEDEKFVMEVYEVYMLKPQNRDEGIYSSE